MDWKVAMEIACGENATRGKKSHTRLDDSRLERGDGARVLVNHRRDAVQQVELFYRFETINSIQINAIWACEENATRGKSSVQEAWTKKAGRMSGT